MDQEIKAIMDAAYDQARSVLEANKESLSRLAQALLKYETLDAEEVKLIVAGQKFDKPSVNDLLERESKKSQAPAQSPKPRAAEGAGPAIPEPA
jgi:cell division protease FtsH